MDRESIMILTKIIIDFFCLFVVSMGVLMFWLYGQPFQRGFFCGDESLAYPYGESTITSLVLYIVGLFLPICIMIFGEYNHGKKIRGQSSKIFFGYSIAPWIWKAYYHVGVFGFGAASTVLTTDIGKYTIGRLRPHFLTVCNPDICSIEGNTGRYITNFTCNPIGFDAKTVKETRLSFPSGHSSFSAYTMIYLILYLQLRIQWKNSKILKHFIQLMCFFMAWFTALSRVSNYKHHWSDVLAGSTLGVVIALVVANYIGNIFREEKPAVEEGENLRDTEYGTEGTQGESSPLRNFSPRYDGTPTD